jgi:hypothetical protein
MISVDFPGHNLLKNVSEVLLRYPHLDGSATNVLGAYDDLSGYCPIASSVNGWKISKKKQMMTRRIRRRAASVMIFATVSLNSFSMKRAVCAI